MYGFPILTDENFSRKEQTRLWWNRIEQIELEGEGVYTTVHKRKGYMPRTLNTITKARPEEKIASCFNLLRRLNQRQLLQVRLDPFPLQSQLLLFHLPKISELVVVYLTSTTENQNLVPKVRRNGDCEKDLRINCEMASSVFGFSFDSCSARERCELATIRQKRKAC